MSASLPRKARRPLTTLVFVVVVGGIAALGQHVGWWLMPPGTDASAAIQPGTYAIDHFIDGDTIAVTMNGTVEKVRFIGVDTPETHKPNTPVQCYGPAAAAHTKNIIAYAGGRVRLAADALSTNRDRYDRLLRYVYLPDGTFVNEVNVRQGYAFYYPFFPFSKSDQFTAAQQEAQNAHRGLWGACTPTPVDGGGYKMEQPANQ